MTRGFASFALGLLVLLSGCIAPSDSSGAGASVSGGADLKDLPALEPSLVTGFHRVADVELLQDSLAAYPTNVATPFVLGKSVEDHDVLGVRLTAPGDASGRVRVIIDGGIHGNEVYGAEAAMYDAGWLVENYGINATATRILETTDIRIVLLLNPDGREADTRENTNKVDMNRNFDVDFGNPQCRAQPVSPDVAYYSGPRPLSEPETKALADLMAEFRPEIYLSHHTGRHALIRPWAACNPPHPMPASDNDLFEWVEKWTRDHTTYQNTGTAEETATRVPSGGASGSSTDWCYLTYHCVALTLEVTEIYGEAEVDPLTISKEAFPITLHILANARSYAAWTAPA